MSLASHALPALVSDVGNKEIASCINTLCCISRRHVVQTAAIHWHNTCRVSDATLTDSEAQLSLEN